MIDASRRSALGLLASCMVHAAIVLATHGYSRASEQTKVQPLWLELQVQAREPPPASSSPAASAALPAADQKLPPDPEPVRSARLPRTTQPRPAAVAPAPPAPMVEVSPLPGMVVDGEDGRAAQAPDQTRGRSPSPAPFDLSPLAAARTLGDSTQSPLRDAGSPPKVGPALSYTAGADALAARVPGLRASQGPGRSAAGALVDGAEDAIYSLLRPWKLLRKSMGGSLYRYTGAGFDAAILPDGRVRFRDKDSPALTVMVTPSRETGPSLLLPPAPAGGFSLGDPAALLSRLRGKDPFAAERRTFLERTRALREYLAGRAAERGPEPTEASDDAEPRTPALEPPAPGP